MAVESMAEFSLFPSFAAADSFETDAAAAAAAASLLGGGSFTTLRSNDVSPFSGMSDQSPQLGLDLAGTTGNDQLFHSAEAAQHSRALLQQQQQQQQQPPTSTDEQCIDAEISRLLQMKQALHRQRQQPLVHGQGQHTAAPILGDEPFMVQQSQSSLTMQPLGSGSSSGGLIPPVSLSLDQSLQMDWWVPHQRLQERVEQCTFALTLAAPEVAIAVHKLACERCILDCDLSFVQSLLLLSILQVVHAYTGPQVQC
jgi:hypothetical protein